jgi:hypothetical protein
MGRLWLFLLSVSFFSSTPARQPSMEEAVEKLERALNEGGEAGLIIGLLEEIASCDISSEEAVDYDLDDLLLQSYERMDEENRGKFILLLADLVAYMRDPRNIYESIRPLLTPTCGYSLEIAHVIFIVKKNFSFEFGDFYSSLFECISKEQLEDDRCRKLFLILNILEDRSVPLGIVKAIIKKLCRTALEMGTKGALEIVWCVLWLMRMHPMAFVMARSDGYDEELEFFMGVTLDKFQPYLHELEILYESVAEIKKVIDQIWNEANNPRNRMRLVTLANFGFPALESA